MKRLLNEFALVIFLPSQISQYFSEGSLKMIGTGAIVTRGGGHLGRNATFCRRRGRVLWAGAACLAAAVYPGIAQADVISDVNAALNQIITVTSSSLVDGPPEVAREIAIVNTAMFNAVNAASSGQYQSYDFSGGTVADASATAAALQAGYSALSGLFLSANSPYVQYQGQTAAAYYAGVPGTAGYPAGLPIGPSNSAMTAVAAIIGTLNDQITALGNSTAVISGIALGTTTAASVANAQSTDGSYNAIIAGLTPYETSGAGTTPGIYVSPAGRPAMMPTWGSVTPLGLSSAQMNALVATVPSAPDISSPGYARSLLQTECLGGATTISGSLLTTCVSNGFDPSVNLTRATSQTAPANLSTLTPNQVSAMFWNDPGTTNQPPGQWLAIADNVAEQQNLDLLSHARTDALLGMALDAAAAGAWQVKYTDNLWRPATALNWGDNIWNDSVIEDPGWVSAIATPPHPDYLAGHPTFSAAAAAVLDATLALRGSSEFCNTSESYANGTTLINGVSGTSAIGGITECFAGSAGQSSFDQAAYEAGQSRIWGGIHTSLAVDASNALGAAIGAQILSNDLQVPEPASLGLLAGCLLMLAGVRHGRGTPRGGRVAADPGFGT